MSRFCAGIMISSDQNSYDMPGPDLHKNDKDKWIENCPNLSTGCLLRHATSPKELVGSEGRQNSCRSQTCLRIGLALFSGHDSCVWDVRHEGIFQVPSRGAVENKSILSNLIRFETR